MFKQLKSAVFWYYLYKFRRRVLFISLLMIVALFSNAIYADVVEYLTLKQKLYYLEYVLIGKWVIIIANSVLSLYLLLTLFHSTNNSEAPQVEESTPTISTKTLTERERSFLDKKKLRTEADILLKK